MGERPPSPARPPPPPQRGPFKVAATPGCDLGTLREGPGLGCGGRPVLFTGAAPPNPGLLPAPPDRQQRPPSPGWCSARTWGVGEALRRWDGAPGGAGGWDGGVCSHPATEPAPLWREERGGGYLSARVLPCLPGETRVLRVSVEPKTPCAGVSPERVPGLQAGWAPSQLCLSFPAGLGAASSLRVRDVGRGEGGQSILSCTPKCVWALLPSV